MRYRVKRVSDLPKNLGGLNCYAARDLRIPYPYPCSTVLVARGLTKTGDRETVLHEKLEAEIMRTTRLPYRRAHKLTETIEKLFRRV